LQNAGLNQKDLIKLRNFPNNQVDGEQLTGVCASRGHHFCYLLIAIAETSTDGDVL